jgi:hypothetical protein
MSRSTQAGAATDRHIKGSGSRNKHPAPPDPRAGCRRPEPAGLRETQRRWDVPGSSLAQARYHRVQAALRRGAEAGLGADTLMHEGKLGDRRGLSTKG